MELLLFLAGGGAVVLAERFRRRRLDGETARADLETVRTLADEDVTLLGEELHRLDQRLAGSKLDDDARLDYQKALDAYEAAGRTVRRLRSADEVSLVADTLATGRHALACVRARVAGLPVPEVRPPCFFNPQHGPSVREVLWTQTGRGTRMVPACSQDAARVASKERPDVRYVMIGSRKVPYWEAGAAFAPYVSGYHVATPAYVFDVYSATFGADPGLFGHEDGGQVDLGAVGGEGGH